MNVRLILVVAVAMIATQANAQERGGRQRRAQDHARPGQLQLRHDHGQQPQEARRRRRHRPVDPGTAETPLAAAKLLLTEEQAFEAMQAFEKDVAAKQAEESKRFLVDNKKRPGVKTTSSGLQYKILKAGKGPKPKSDDVVSVNYRASFVNGTEFEIERRQAVHDAGRPGHSRLAGSAANDGRRLQVAAVRSARSWPTANKARRRRSARTPRWCSRSSWSRSTSRATTARKKPPSSQKQLAPVQRVDRADRRQSAADRRVDSVSSTGGISTDRTRPAVSTSSTRAPASPWRVCGNSSAVANRCPSTCWMRSLTLQTGQVGWRAGRDAIDDDARRLGVVDAPRDAQPHRFSRQLRASAHARSSRRDARP